MKFKVIKDLDTYTVANNDFIAKRKIKTLKEAKEIAKWMNRKN